MENQESHLSFKYTHTPNTNSHTPTTFWNKWTICNIHRGYTQNTTAILYWKVTNSTLTCWFLLHYHHCLHIVIFRSSCFFVVPYSDNALSARIFFPSFASCFIFVWLSCFFFHAFKSVEWLNNKLKERFYAKYMDMVKKLFEPMCMRQLGWLNWCTLNFTTNHTNKKKEERIIVQILADTSASLLHRYV